MVRSDTRSQAGLWLAGVMAVSIVAGNARGEEKPKAPRLEFRILANEVDEPKVLEAAMKVFASAKKTFFAGGDLNDLLKVERADEATFAMVESRDCIMVAIITDTVMMP